MLKQQCDEFLLNPTRNPITGRAIKIDGPTYKKLMTECAKFKSETKKKPSTSPEFRNPPIPKKIVCLMVIGLGCSEMTPEELIITEKQFSNQTNLNVKILCNTKLGDTISTIVKSVCFIKPSLKSKFVQDIFAQVMSLLKQNNKVLLVGHSYGGCVVARVAELMFSQNIIPNQNEMTFLTFGSIYIPEQCLTGLNIFHYMYRDDVALKCNKLHHIKNKGCDVVWLRPNNYSTPAKHTFSFFGTSSEWNIHNSYDVAGLILKHKNI